MKLTILRTLFFINIALITVLLVSIQRIEDIAIFLVILGVSLSMFLFLQWKKDDYRVKKFINSFF